MSKIRSVYSSLGGMLFGCNHGHLTRPFTLHAHSYKVCLDCGRQLPYSIEKMRLLRAWEIPNSEPRRAELVTVPVARSFSRSHAFAKVEDSGDNRAIA